MGPLNSIDPDPGERGDSRCAGGNKEIEDLFDSISSHLQRASTMGLSSSIHEGLDAMLRKTEESPFQAVKTCFQLGAGLCALTAEHVSQALTTGLRLVVANALPDSSIDTNVKN